MRIFTIILLIIISQFSYSQTRPKIGLVLSGGGAKGSAHVGALRFLESKGIKPDYIAGTSVGAMIGGLYAMGYTVDELEDIIVNTDWDFLQKDEINRRNLLIGQGGKNKNSIVSLPIEGFKPVLSSGLYAGQNLMTFLGVLSRKYGKDISFDSLMIPFRCVATNLETGKATVFDHGNLAKSIRSSMTIPTILTPYEIEDELYVDGGLVNNFPTNVVKEMGADIIIGVDVGAVLYKKEELKTVMQILDQSSSFFGAMVSLENKKLCDIYIRPDIEGISALDFSVAPLIIDRGMVAAQNEEGKIDSIFGKYNLAPIVDRPNYIDTNIINIESLVINTNISSPRKHNSAMNLILGKLNLETPARVTVDELQNKINKLYGSRYFQDIVVTFEQKDTSYILNVSAREQTESEFYMGARYDNIYGIDLAIGANFRNKLIYGSLLEFKLVAGQSPQAKIRYTTDRGSRLGFGSSLEYNDFMVSDYNDGSVYLEFTYRRLFWDAFIHSYIGDYSRLILGAEASIFGLTSTTQIVGFEGLKQKNLSVYGAYVVDSWDDGYFPNKGTKFKLRGDGIVNEDGSLMYTLWGRSNTVIPISKRFVFKVDAFLGIGSKAIGSTVYSYYIGGMGRNKIQWYTPFPGLHFLENGSSNTATISVGPRWNFAKNQYLTYKFAFAVQDYLTEHLLIMPEDTYAGMSLAYGFKSMFGPIEAAVDLSLNDTYGSFYVSLGFWL